MLSTLAQSKERKGSYFAIWQPCTCVLFASLFLSSCAAPPFLLPEQNRDIIANDSVYNSRFNYAVSQCAMPGKYRMKGEGKSHVHGQNRLIRLRWLHMVGTWARIYFSLASNLFSTQEQEINAGDDICFQLGLQGNPVMVPHFRPVQIEPISRLNHKLINSYCIALKNGSSKRLIP